MIPKEDRKIVFRVIWEIVIKSHNRFRFLRLLIRTLKNRPELLYTAVELAIYGHHFEKIMKKVVKNKPKVKDMPIPQSIPFKSPLKPSEILIF